jgi:3-hydroxyacyl-CoA dehydrogenase
MTQISKIGVIGAGNMGSGIAQKIAQEGINVVMARTGRRNTLTHHRHHRSDCRRRRGSCDRSGF